FDIPMLRSFEPELLDPGQSRRVGSREIDDGPPVRRDHRQLGQSLRAALDLEHDLGISVRRGLLEADARNGKRHGRKGFLIGPQRQAITPREESDHGKHRSSSCHAEPHSRRTETRTYVESTALLCAFPNRKYREGTTNRLSNVDVTRPPRMTTAIGCSISWPGRLPATTKGTMASPVADLATQLAALRSAAPARTAPGPKV